MSQYRRWSIRLYKIFVHAVNCGVGIEEMTDLKEIISIRSVLPADTPAIAEIYNHYVRETIITFEDKPVTHDEIDKRIQEVLSLKLPWLIAELNNKIVGYAYASKWRERTAYRFSVEVTVYVDPDHFRQGIGFQLYSQLLSSLKAKGIHAAMGGIALPNSASVGLHEKLGFKKVAHLKEVGFKFDQWIDVGYWQLVL
jgi:L-amino acid N-acyltransferase YncA